MLLKTEEAVVEEEEVEVGVVFINKAEVDTEVMNS